jgi:hypothetical protein
MALLSSTLCFYQRRLYYLVDLSSSQLSSELTAPNCLTNSSKANIVVKSLEDMKLRFPAPKIDLSKLVIDD